jgi:adenine phosphoribosyltransferase
LSLIEPEEVAKLVEISKREVAGFIFVINLFDLGGCDKLIKKNY